MSIRGMAMARRGIYTKCLKLAEIVRGAVLWYTATSVSTFRLGSRREWEIRSGGVRMARDGVLSAQVL